jgi:ribosomal protein S12 methylthiotransferase accessory factor
MLTLKSTPKGYTFDTHRVRPPEETLKVARSSARSAGITRVADITGLDRLGIPVFTSMRPRARDGAVTVYNGKGFTPQEAETSAIMEGVERYSAEVGGFPLVAGNLGNLGREGYEVLDPTRLILPSLRRYSHADELEWVLGTSISRCAEILVPAEAVFHPYERANQLIHTNTNGLAVGNAMEEAVFHGLMELIERDAWSLFEVDTGRSRDILLGGRQGGCKLVLETKERLEAAAVKVFLKDITSDVGIPTIAAALDDEMTKDPALLSLGVGSHTVAEIAVLRALTEAVQSRLTTIHGTREDTFKAEFARRIGYERMRKINRKWFEPSRETVRMKDIGSHPNKDFLDDINFTMDRLRGSGLDEVIVVDLTRKELGIPAVRVIVPGLEVYAMDRDRAGERLRAAISRAAR